MLLKKFTLLYVEDEQDLRDIMKDVLSDVVKTLYTAKDGKEAYALYKDHKPDIILSDINMPNLDGIGLGKLIRQTDQTTRILLLTAYSDVESLLAATELKLTKYILKPTKENELFDALFLAAEELESFNITYKKQLVLKENYKWDFSEQLLSCDMDEIHLTPKEKQILQILFSNLNATVSYDTLLYEVWEDSDVYNLDTVKAVIKNLRKKLPENTIENIYGTGFKVQG